MLNLKFLVHLWDLWAISPLLPEQEHEHTDVYFPNFKAKPNTRLLFTQQKTLLMISCLADTGHSVYKYAIDMFNMSHSPFTFFHSWYLSFDDQICLMAFFFAGLHEKICSVFWLDLVNLILSAILMRKIFQKPQFMKLPLILPSCSRVIFRRKREMSRSGTVLVNLCKCVSIKVDMTSSLELEIVGEGRREASSVRVVSNLWELSIWYSHLKYLTL